MAGHERAGSVSDFPEGAMVPVSIGTREIAVVRLGERYYAFDNYCSHEAVTFTSGYGVIAKNRVICMMHSSAFDIETGEVLAGPAPDPLTLYDVKVAGDDVLVAL